MKEIFVLVTMDVEKALPADRPASTTGPRNYEESAVFIEAYVERAKSHGFPVSFMIHPEVTHEHKELFNQLEEDGACLGLHLHPWKFLDGRYKAHFGGLTRDEQRDILGKAMAMWSEYPTIDLTITSMHFKYVICLTAPFMMIVMNVGFTIFCIV